MLYYTFKCGLFHLPSTIFRIPPNQQVQWKRFKGIEYQDQTTRIQRENNQDSMGLLTVFISFPTSWCLERSDERSWGYLKIPNHSRERFGAFPPGFRFHILAPRYCLSSKFTGDLCFFYTRGGYPFGFHGKVGRKFPLKFRRCFFVYLDDGTPLMTLVLVG